MTGARTVTFMGGPDNPSANMIFPGNVHAQPTPVNDGAGLTFGDGLLCAGNEAVRIQVTTAGPGGSVDTSVEVSTNGQVHGHTIESGETVNYQCWYRDDVAVSPCGNSFNTTNGYEIIWVL